jgi:lambda family phage tail tape measure protein
MANSLGTLTLDLVARIGGFTGPLDAAARQTKKFEKSVEKAGERIGKGLAGGITAATAALAYMVTKQLQVIGDQDDLAKRLRTTVGSLGVLTRAGELSGVGLDQLTSGSQKLDLALGKAAQGSKTQVEAFDRLGLKYAEVAELPIDERISAINEALVKNVPAYERAAVAATLFGGKNAAAFQQLDPETLAEANRQITVFGVKLSDIESSKVEAAGDAISIFGLAADGVAKQLTVELSPLLTQLSKDFLDSAEAAGGLGTTVQQTTRTVLEAIGFVVDAGDGVGRVFKIISAELDGLVASAAGSITAAVFQVATGLNKLGADIDTSGLEANFNKLSAQAVDATERMRKAAEEPLAGTAFLEYYDKAQKAANNATIAFGAAAAAALSGGMTAEQYAALVKAREAAAKAAAAAAKKIDEAFKSAETDYERQIALINTTTDAQKNATEVAKLGFEIQSGKLVGINALQQQRLEGLAAELDALAKVKQANEDAAKASAFGATLDSANQTVKQGFELELAGAGSGDKLKDRLKQDLAIQQDYNKQVADLQKQLNGGDITQELYETETAMLEEALAERMILQEDYYNQLDEMQNNWIDGVTSAWENYRDTATDYSQQAADATSTVLSDTTNSVAENIDGLLRGTETVGSATKNVVLGIANSVISAIEQMAAQWLVYQAVQLITGKTTQASAATAMIANAQATAFQASLAAFASTAAIPIVGPFAAPAAAAAAASFAAPLVAGVATSALSGMAHDGIDAVPETGTWLLQKGERVTTAETSAKLDSTLNDIRSNPANGNSGGTTVNLIEDASRAGQSKERTGDQGERMIDVFVADLLGDGRSADALNRKFGLSGVGR